MCGGKKGGVCGRETVCAGGVAGRRNQIKAMYIVHARAAVNLINNHMYT